MIIKKLPDKLSAQISVPSSKSISNRLLILREISDKKLTINGLSNANDTKILGLILDNLDNSDVHNLNVDNAGTVFRFLTAYLSIRPGKYILNGDDRLKQRPIIPLVNSLKKLGANISFIYKFASVPLYIEGRQLNGGSVEIDCSLSSQFASALMLIAPALHKGLKISIIKPASKKYIELTFNLLKKIGIPAQQQSSNKFFIPKHSIQPQTITVEKDWSAATFWYAFASLAKQANILLKDLNLNSIQGDKFISNIYEKLGIVSTQLPEGVLITKISDPQIHHFKADLRDYPDLAIPLIVNLILLNIKFSITGLAHLHYKESDRILALKNELQKTGIKLVELKNGELTWVGKLNIPKNIKFNPHNDHRIAMALSQLAMFENIIIENPDTVNKSYPNFWQNLEYLYINKN